MAVVDISWSSHKLERTCSGDRGGIEHWGADHWKLLRRRLAALSAAPTLADMDGVSGNCHQLHADRDGDFAVDLWGPYRLIFEPNHDPVPLLDDGGVDKRNVTHITIKEVDDYHGR